MNPPSGFVRPDQVALVGAGTGLPGLLTVRATEVLAAADDGHRGRVVHGSSGSGSGCSLSTTVTGSRGSNGAA